MLDNEEKPLSFPDIESFSALPTAGGSEPSNLKSQALSDIPSDNVIESKIECKSRRTACKGLFLDYSKRSTIHGIRYLFEVDRPFYEKIYWWLGFLVSIHFAVSLMWDTYLKWQDTPVILGFDETLVPVHKIPFPTVTICPDDKVYKPSFNFSSISKQIWDEIQQHGKFENIANITEEHIATFAATLQVCDTDVLYRFAKHIPKDVLPDVTKTLINLIAESVAAGCLWNGRPYFSECVLTYVPTDEGICYQFNGLLAEDIYRDKRYISYHGKKVADFDKYVLPAPHLNNITGDWSLERGYIGQGFNAYPLRTVFSSARNAFLAFLHGSNVDLDHTCRGFKQGYRVYLNSPESVPMTTGNFIWVPHGKEVMVRVQPQYVTASKDLRGFSPAKRQCYFDNERYLRFFRTYSQNNCQTECLTNYTISKCGCVKFWMPKPLDVPVCALADISCYNAAQEELNIRLLKQTMQRSSNPDTEMKCDCMPSCTSLEYNFEISSTSFDFITYLRALRQHDIPYHLRTSRLSVYFKEHQFTAVKRTAAFGVTRLIAYCGGIFGLFMGISILSIIELIYFFTVRLICYLWERGVLQKRMHQQRVEDQTN